MSKSTKKSETPKKKLFIVKVSLSSTVVVFATNGNEAEELAKANAVESLSASHTEVELKGMLLLTEASQMVGTGWRGDCLPYRSSDDDGEQTIGQILRAKDLRAQIVPGVEYKIVAGSGPGYFPGHRIEVCVDGSVLNRTTLCNLPAKMLETVECEVDIEELQKRVKAQEGLVQYLKALEEQGAV